jgi:hypothetical protein
VVYGGYGGGAGRRSGGNWSYSKSKSINSGCHTAGKIARINIANGDNNIKYGTVVKNNLSPTARNTNPNAHLTLSQTHPSSQHTRPNNNKKQTSIFRTFGQHQEQTYKKEPK